MENNKELLRLMKCFRGSFINSNNELIIDKKTNIYFRLEDVETELQLRYKVLEWISRSACKAEPYSNYIQHRVGWHGIDDYNDRMEYKYNPKNTEFQNNLLNGINKFLGTNFTKNDMTVIYSELGNSECRPLCEIFVSSGYDISVLTDFVECTCEFDTERKFIRGLRNSNIEDSKLELKTLQRKIKLLKGECIE